MIEIIMLVDSPNIQGIKETLAEYCEKFGDTKIIKVKEIEPEQLKI